MLRKWRSIIRPKRLEVDEKTLTGSYGKFTAEPFDRGFGLTVGNALRRVMISSIQGTAVTAVRIEGVLHEFSTLPGVREDVTEIIMNLKEVVFKLHSEGPELVHIKAKGAGDVTAADIVTNANLEVLNPEQHIAALSADAKLEIEITVNSGVGYAPVERTRDDEASLGTIPVDAIYSPVRKVNYTITHSRIGQITDYERLSLEVWTNGAVSPEDAIAYAAKILQSQLQIFVNFDEDYEEPQEIEQEKPACNDNLYRSIDELELSVRSSNCLRNASIRYIWELVQRSEPEMLKTKNFGRKSLNEIKEILSDMGLTLGMKLEGFVPPPDRGSSADAAGVDENELEEVQTD